MNFDDFSYEENGRRYIKPQINLDESNRFIDNLRGIQQTNNDQIRQDTYNLGTAVPSNLGGLVGGGSYFKSRFQTPQTNSLVADLRATAQATALQEAMSNELAKAKKRYSDAYRAAKKSTDKASSSSSGNSLQDTLDKLGVNTENIGGDKQNTDKADPDNIDTYSDVKDQLLMNDIDAYRKYADAYRKSYEDSVREKLKVYTLPGNVEEDVKYYMDALDRDGGRVMGDGWSLDKLFNGNTDAFKEMAEQYREYKKKLNELETEARNRGLL